MDRKEQLDQFGVLALTGVSLLLAFNQVLVKVTNGGFQPVFFAGVRSAGVIFCLWLWLTIRGKPLDLRWRTHGALGVLLGVVFAFEFMFLFLALDRTTVVRSAVIFYSMPLWLSLGAHVFLPDDRLTMRKALGLCLALSGVGLAMMDRQGGVASWTGDLLALVAAVLWAMTALLAKGTRLREVRPESQLMWQVAVSAPVLLVMAPLFGDLLRDPQPIHYAGLLFQIVAVVTGGFLAWLWLLSIYPASSVGSFAFLAPVLAVFLGWAILGEPVGPVLIAALTLVAVGIVLINRPAGAKRPT